ncbi:transferase, partial [Streptomyces niveus]
MRYGGPPVAVRPAYLPVLRGGAGGAPAAQRLRGVIWRSESDGFGVNHDKSNRPRRQDRPQEFL